MISLRTHNVLDYVGGAILVLAPWIFGFTEIDVARNVFNFLGFGLIAYSLLTRYRYSVAKIIPLGVHMVLDVSAGVILMLAPSVLDYADLITGAQYTIHFVLGLGVIAMVAFTRRTTGDVRVIDRTTDTDVDYDIDRRAA